MKKKRGGAAEAGRYAKFDTSAGRLEVFADLVARTFRFDVNLTGDPVRFTLNARQSCELASVARSLWDVGRQRSGKKAKRSRALKGR